MNPKICLVKEQMVLRTHVNKQFLIHLPPKETCSDRTKVNTRIESLMLLTCREAKGVQCWNQDRSGDQTTHRFPTQQKEGGPSKKPNYTTEIFL